MSAICFVLRIEVVVRIDRMTRLPAQLNLVGFLLSPFAHFGAFGSNDLG